MGNVVRENALVQGLKLETRLTKINDHLSRIGTSE